MIGIEFDSSSTGAGLDGIKTAGGRGGSWIGSWWVVPYNP